MGRFARRRSQSPEGPGKEANIDVETHRAFERHNPQREIDWLWQRACRIVAERRNTSKKRDDPAIIAAVSYHRALDRCQTERDRESLRRR